MGVDLASPPPASLAPKDIRDALCANPDILLEDAQTLQHLMAHHHKKTGQNVLNFQGVVIDRLRDQLSLAEEDHRALLEIAVANMHALDQIHQACLAMLEAESPTALVTAIQTRLPQILDADYANLAIERQTPSLPFSNGITAEPGALGFYFQLRGSVPISGSQEKVVLRRTFPEADVLYGDTASVYQSEALALLDLGPRVRPALLFFADKDPERFSPTQSADLLLFMVRVAELIVQKWQHV